MSDTSPTLQEAFDSFLEFQTLRSVADNTDVAYRQDFKAIMDRIGKSPDEMLVAVLNRKVLVSAFVDYANGVGRRYQKKGQPLRKRADRSMLRVHSTWTKFFDFLVMEELVEGSPMPGIPKPPPPSRKPMAPEGWESDFQAKLFKAMNDGVRGGQGKDDGQALYRVWPERDLAIVVLLCAAGIRASELCALDINSFEGIPPEFVVRVVGKGDKHRAVPVEPEIDEVLGQYLESRKARLPKWKMKTSDPLFLGSRNESGTKRITRAQLNWIIKTAYQRSGMDSRRHEGTMTHSLRHLYGTDLAAKNVPVNEIKELMGHSSINTTQGYMTSIAKNRREGAKKNSAYEALAKMKRMEE